MPLHNKKPLERIPPPANLQITDQVYFLEASGEIFSTYDAFFNRMILLNSTDFSCSLTGKTGLTYFEALESEKEAKEELANFPPYLEEPILYLVQYLTCRGRLDDVLSDVTVFMKDRYFIGEELFWHDGRRKREAKIEGVSLADDYLSQRSSASPRKGPGYDMGLPPPEAYRYDIQLLIEEDADDDDDESDDGKREATRASDLSRSRANMSKQKLKLFLKNSCELIDKRQEVKDSFRRDNRLDHLSWSQFFSDPPPVFPQTPLLFRGRPTKTPIKPEPAVPKEKGQRGRKRKEGGAEKNGEATPNKKGRKSAAAAASEQPSPRKISEKKRKQIEAQQEELEPQFDVARRLGVEDLDRFEQRERVLTPKDIEDFKELIKQGRVKEREETKARKEREKKEKAEWRKPRDDLACDDLQPLPSYARLPLPDWLTPDDFSAYLNLYQFFISFQEILPIKEIRGASRISLSDVIIAIRCPDPSSSSLADLLRILWGARQERAEEEDGDEAAVSRLETCEEMENERWAGQIRSRNELHDQMRQAFGVSVRNLQVDWLTMSEAVRLHLLTAGYYTGACTSRFRWTHRGGLRCYEDPAYAFVEEHPDVMKKLETLTIFDLSPAQRLAVLQVFVDELLSYQKFRTYHEERTAELAETKKQLKMLRNWAIGQEKEAKDASLVIDNEDLERPKPSAETKRLRAHLKAAKESRRVDKADMEQLVLSGVAYSELADLEEISAAREVQRECYEKSEDELMERIFQMEGLSCLVFLGRDRSYRSYFFLDALPALLVEEPSEWDRERTGGCEEPTPLNESIVSSFNGNIHSARLGVTGCTADEYCPAHGSEARDRPRWQMVDSVEKYEQLHSALNPRGFRESELLEQMGEKEKKLREMIERSSRKHESGAISTLLMTDSTDPADMKGTIDFEMEMREVLADLEEKIFLGQIGCLPSSIDRLEWRRRLLEDGDVTGLITGDVAIRVEGALKEEEEAGDGEMEILYYQTEFSILSSNEKLAFALLQLFQSIHFRCFKEPFITRNRQNGERNISEVFLVWQRTLSENAKSAPMVALFLYTLDSKIAWDMSRYQGKCRVCRKKGDAEQFVLCDDCCVTYHLTCVRPRLDVAVTGWLCSECKAVRRREAAKEKRNAAREAAQRAEEENGEEDEEGGFAGDHSNSTDRQMKEEGESKSGSEERIEPVKTSSGRIVKKVLYNENYNGAVIVTKGKRPEKVKEDWTDYDSADSEMTNGEEEEESPKRTGKKRKVYDPHHDAVRVSIGLRETTGSLKECLHDCELAIKDTMGQYCAWPFLAPVDKREVPDYYDVIKHPMDLQTMITKIKNNTYDSLDEVQADLDQMIANCKKYNEESSEIVELALRTSEYLQPKLDSIMRRIHR